MSQGEQAASGRWEWQGRSLPPPVGMQPGWLLDLAQGDPDA